MEIELHSLVMRPEITIQSVRKLLKKIENVNAADRNGNTPLHLAAANDQDKAEVIVELIKTGAMIQSVNNDQNTPLHLASFRCNPRVAEALIQFGANVNATNICGNTPLHFAVAGAKCDDAKGNSKVSGKWIVQKLIQNGSDVNFLNNIKQTPLMWAVYEGNLDIVKELLISGANVNLCNNFLESCLHISLDAPYPNHELLTELIKFGADTRKNDIYFRTPLDMAIEIYVDHFPEALKTAKHLCRMEVLYKKTSEIRFLRWVRDETILSPLSKFYRTCFSEVDRMNFYQITENISLREFAKRGINCSVFSSNVLMNHVFKVALRAVLKHDYSEYSDVIASQIPREYLKEFLMQLVIFAINTNDLKRVVLTSDALFTLSDYLVHKDIILLIKAFLTVEGNDFIFED